MSIKEALKLISGARGFWFYVVEVDGKEIGGGYFYRKKDAARHLVAAVSKL